MVNTSAGYDPFPAVRSPDALVSFEIIPKALIKSELTVATETAAKVGTIGNVVNEVPDLTRKYGTLEWYGWPLDGSCRLLPSSGAEEGFWSEEVSDSEGRFRTPIVIRFDVDEPIETYGWTFHFDAPANVAADRVRAVWYDDRNNMLGEIDCSPEAAGEGEDRGWQIRQFAAQYSAVEFTFYGTNQPFRMLRVAEIDFGISRYFTRESVTDVKIRYGTSVDASKFPAKELTFVFDNSDGEFNILNPVGVYQYWRNGQILRAKIRIGDDIVNMGMFTETTAEIGKNRLLVKVKASDPCSRLARQSYDPSEAMTGADSVTLRQAAEDVLAGYDLRIEYNGLENEPVSCQVSGKHQKRAMLRYLAQAARCSVWIDRNNTVQFRRFVTPETEDAVSAITADELYDWSGVSVAEEYSGCVLTVKRELEVVGEGDNASQGTAYTYTAGVSDGEGVNTASYENPCIAPGQEQAVCDWLLTAANWQKKYAVKNRCDPAVEIGDAVIIEDAFHNNDAAIVTGLEVTYDGVLSCVTTAERSFG